MTAPAPRSGRMVTWLVIAPAVLLLLAFAGANWRFFHLAYCRHLIKTGDGWKRIKAFRIMYRNDYLRGGMDREAALALFSPWQGHLWGPEHIDFRPPLAPGESAECWGYYHRGGGVFLYFREGKLWTWSEAMGRPTRSSPFVFPPTRTPLPQAP